MRLQAFCTGLALCLLLAGQQALAQRLLWLTVDITPAARTALVENEARAQGWQFASLDHPLAANPVRLEAERAALAKALAKADLVWLDVPHESVLQRLQQSFGSQLQASGKPLVWIAPDAKVGRKAGEQQAAWLAAGGAANTRHALAYAKRWLAAGQPDSFAASEPPPQPLPRQALYHPDAPALFADSRQLETWRQGQTALRGQAAVAVLVHRHHFVNGETAWLDDWLRRFRQQGLFAYAVFGQQLDAKGLEGLLDQGEQAHPRVLVLHQLVTQAAALQPLFLRWGVPVLATQPYRHGDAASWQADGNGLKLSDTPFYLVQPEAAGAIDPMLVTALQDGGRKTQLIARQADAVAAKAKRLIQLAELPRAQRQLVAMVYNYPPGGNHFGASFLNVPRSLETVSQGLAANGYRVTPLAEQGWIDGLKPLLAAYYEGSDLLGLLRNNQAAALPVRQYRQWWQSLPSAQRERIKSRWGEPESSRYVVSWQGEPVFVIPRLQRGQLSVLPQPPREETLHRGSNPFMHRSRQPLSHHYLAVYLWAQQAQALIHFGTHGTQEWANGKSRALDVLDDALLPLGDVPVIYPYIVDNLGEALTAKRRGRALMLSHRTPVFATTGLSPGMHELHELMHEYAIADNGPTKQQAAERVVGLIVSERLHHDLKWTEEQVRARLDDFLEALHPWLDQLAHSSQPQGLASYGQVPEAALRQKIILQMLRTPLLDALGEDVDEAFLLDQDKIAQSRPMRWLQLALTDAEAASRLDLRREGQGTAVPNRAGERGIDSEALLQLAQEAQRLDALLQQENELPGLLAALDGRFVAAAYGGDPIRNPDSLPTGRNLTGLDPSRLPTRQAYTVAQLLFGNWLQQWRAANVGREPQQLALSLWAGETLRHQGIMEAQALVALGVRPIWDSAGRPTRLEVIPAAELGRPRVDVMLSITGSYRDQFPALMALLDQAVTAVSQAEPDGNIARHSREVSQELSKRGVRPSLAAALGQARVFGNPIGDYGTGIDAAVQDGRLQREDARLGQLFLRRLSQPYLAGEAVTGLDEATAIATLSARLKRTDAAIMARSSHLYGMVTSDDPFQYLGGLAAAARVAGKTESLALYVNQLQNADEPYSQSAQDSIALEMQSRYLHPGWIRALKAEGYAGTLQVLKAVQNSWGWQSIVSDSVRADHWQGFYDVLVADKHRQGIPEWLRSHPQAYAQTLERLIQAQRHGHWQPDTATQQTLAARYRELTQQAALPTELKVVRDWVRQQLGEAAPLAAKPVAARQISADKVRGVSRQAAGASLPAPRSAIPPGMPMPQAVADVLEKAAVKTPQRVQGILLKPQPPALSGWWLTLLLLPFAAGLLWQWRRSVPARGVSSQTATLASSQRG